MARFTVAHLTPPPSDAPAGAPQHVTVSTTHVTVIVALIGIVPALTTAGVDVLLKSQVAAEVQRADAAVKNADAEAKRAASGDAWLRAALAIKDPTERANAVRFLVTAGLARKLEDHSISTAPQLPLLPADK